MMQVEPCSPCEHLSINHQANDKRESDWIDTTKKKWAKTKTVKNFGISTHNRFSYWEDESGDEGLEQKDGRHEDGAGPDESGDQLGLE